MNLIEWVSTLFHVRLGVPRDAVQIHGETPPYTWSRGEPHRVGEYTVPCETWGVYSGQVHCAILTFLKEWVRRKHAVGETTTQIEPS